MNNPKPRMLVVGENWQGSSARALRESLERINAFELEDFSSDFLLPRPFKKFNRALARIVSPFFQAEYRSLLQNQIEEFQPRILLAVKAAEIDRSTVEWARSKGIFTANYFPDLSPFAHGKSLTESLGEYDLVASTKQSHPPLWKKKFNFKNECIYIGHGYDPKSHLVESPYRSDAPIDVCMVATWRQEYDQLIHNLVRALDNKDVSIVVAGAGWLKRQSAFGAKVQMKPPITGRAYTELTRSSKIVIAPMTMEPTLLHSIWVPPEQETTRSFQLSAANCFFLHRRTSRLSELYDEVNEVPLWDNADELSQLVLKYLPQPDERARLADNAHRRAVPAYSYDARATELVANLLRRIQK